MSGYGDIRVEQANNLVYVTLPEDERHFVLACKNHYRGDPYQGLTEVYQKIYGINISEPEHEVARILLEIIYRYNILSAEEKFVMFVSHAVFGRMSSFFTNESITPLGNLLRECISAIQIWQVSNRRDGYQYNLGEPDLF